LFSKNKSGCCSIELEDISENNPDQDPKESEKEFEKKEKKNTSCGCC
jgi:hypothetical protein